MRRQTFHVVAGLFMAAAAAIATVDLQGQAPTAGTATTLSVSPDSSAAGETVTLTARVALVNPGPNAPTGTVEFFDVETSLGTATLSATTSGRTAVLAVTSLGAGPHSISAKYLGDTNCAGSSSALVTQVVR